MKKIEIVFDHSGPDYVFVETEQDGKSIIFGKWVHRADGLWVLEIDDPEAIRKERDLFKAIAELQEKLLTAYQSGSLHVVSSYVTDKITEAKRLLAELERS